MQLRGVSKNWSEHFGLNPTFHPQAVTVMFQIDVSAFKTSAYLYISLACFGFVFWQSVQCIEKYIENPKGTKLSLKHTSELHQFPAITVCAPTSERYDIDHLKRCGLR